MYCVSRLLLFKGNLSYFKRYSTATKNSQSSLSIDDMPHRKGFPFIGTRLEFFTAGGGSKLHEYIDMRHKQLGPVFHEKLDATTKLVFISDPILMKSLFINLEGKYPMHILPEPWVLYEKLYGSKRGLFFMNGEEWHTNRKIMNKHLLREGSEKWLQDPISLTIEKFILNWKRNTVHNSFVPDLESDLYKLSTDVIINVLLGSECLSKSKYYEELLTMFSDTVKKIFLTTTKLYGLPVSWYQKLKLKQWTEFKKCVDLSIHLAQKIVHEMLSRREQGCGLIHKLCQENMSDETITRIVADFVIAAGDTTAYTTLWILWLLSQNETEIKAMRIGDKSYVKHVVKESMRLYPVAPFLTRILPKEREVGPYKLVAGTPIIASIYTSGRDENNFSQANNFMPFRWDRKDSRKNKIVNHVPSATLPFAIGTRSCIGKKIAMLQLVEVTDQIVKNFDFTCGNYSKVNAVTSQVLVPDKDIQLIFTQRK